ncbi:MAG: endonuclease/exonuclease/phosphatase family protein [Actinomycetota bacterium]|nr:endonuclease/exonuclease/phosphatase family protein [Actinomycetota bacterium]
MSSHLATLRPRAGRAGLLGAALLGLVMMLPAAADASHTKKGVNVKLMTRNIFLGADLGPALAASNTNEFIEANGEILREVDQTDFPRRAGILADEILSKKPDLVGLQEVALWRTAPPNVTPALTNTPTATTVEYDFLQLLLDELNDGLYDEGSDEYEEGAYEVVVVQEEFDFEAPADENNVDGDGPNAFIPNAEINGRLTMRDVILRRVGSNVKTKNETGGNFENELVVRVANVVNVPVTRGWTQLDATAKKKIKKGKHKGKSVKKKFRFVNSHFEAFDDETERPSIRARQADELIQKAANDDRSIILGDFNSDSPGVKPGDEQAYEVLQSGGLDQPYVTGFRTLADHPGSCCVPDLFTPSPSEFDHQVDHVMTNMPKQKAKRLKSGVTGLTQVGGMYGSDHGGVWSRVKLK